MTARAELEVVAAWAASGAMALSGRPEGPPSGPPERLVPRVQALGARLGVDGPALLGERAAVAGLGRSGEVTCGGAGRLLRSADGFVTLSLARPEDRDLVPALLERSFDELDPWPTVAGYAEVVDGAGFVERARLLGLPAAVLPEHSDPGGDALPVTWTPVEGPSAGPRGPAGARVADLGALWAGPLCGALLAGAGAEVLKVESTGRPDGARLGPPAFFDLLNGGKAGVALDLRAREGATGLIGLLASVDMVIEASRPRALEQLGVDREALMAAGGPQVWVSITGHGRAAPMGDWVAFGDDAAVAGGLVVRDADGPCFCADAVADPLAGMVAAVAATDALARGGRWLVDVAMARVAAWCGGPTLAVPDGLVVAPPRHRPVTAPGPGLGEHTAPVLAAL